MLTYRIRAAILVIIRAENEPQKFRTLEAGQVVHVLGEPSAMELVDCVTADGESAKIFGSDLLARADRIDKAACGQS